MSDQKWTHHTLAERQAAGRQARKPPPARRTASGDRRPTAPTRSPC